MVGAFRLSMYEKKFFTTLLLIYKVFDIVFSKPMIQKYYLVLIMELTFFQSNLQCMQSKPVSFLIDRKQGKTSRLGSLSQVQ